MAPYESNVIPISCTHLTTQFGPSWTVPKQQFIAVGGTKNPNNAPAYTIAVNSMYTVVYTRELASKARPTQTASAHRWNDCYQAR